MTHQATCKTCRVWLHMDDTGLKVMSGLCRSRAPTATEDLWPVTFGHDWCREHEPVKAAAKPPITVMGTGSMDETPFPYQDNCPTLAEIMERRAAREATLTTDEAQQAHKLGMA